MMPKEFMSTDMAQELSTLILRVNDIHTKLTLLQRQIDEHSKLLARQRRVVDRTKHRQQPKSSDPEHDSH